MVGEITADEIELLNAYQLIGPTGQKELKDYLRYLLIKQYKRDVMNAVFENKLLHNLFHSLLHIVERDDFDINQVEKRVKQIKELYYSLFEQIHHRYSEVVEELDSNEIVKEFGRNSFDSINLVLRKGNRNTIRIEIVEFYQQYSKLAKKYHTRKIVAV